jgi:hypothetical protein
MNTSAIEGHEIGPASEKPGFTISNAYRYYGVALLVIVFVTFLWSAIHFFLAARTLREDLALARES